MPRSSAAQPTSRFVAVLASRPPLVALATFAVAGVVTLVLALTTTGLDATGIVSILATVWALALSVVIYLLTAKDTDKLLDHIDALQDQLSATLETPGPGALVVDDAPTRQDVKPGQARLPEDYLAALTSTTGLVEDDLARAWTPIPSGAGPWVVESTSHDRWSVFRGRGGHITVIPLGNADRARQRMDERVRQRRVAMTALRSAKPTKPSD